MPDDKLLNQVRGEHDLIIREMFVAAVRDELRFQRELAFNLIRCPSFMASLDHGTNIRKRYHHSTKER
jgi:hypothetical protein